MDVLEFQCEMCGKAFESERSEEEAMAESIDLWGNVPMQDLSVICDSCFKSMRIEIV